MIPGDFSYHRPDSKAQALDMLRRAGPDGRILAGGHSLIPMMKLRMAAPAQLIDISRIGELKGVAIGGREVEIGAATTQHELIENEQLAAACPIIRETALQIADPQIRYLGTIGGNVGNGDPGNDMPGLMQCLDADYLLESAKGQRSVKARAYYQGAYVTAIADGEMITKIRFALPPKGQGYAYKKLKRKIGDYATAAAAVTLEMAGGVVRRASIALTNVGDTPLYAADAVDRITSTALLPPDIDAAVAAAEAITRPASDGRGSAEYRRRMAGVMVRRALIEAAGRATETADGKDAPKDGKTGGIFGWLKG
ncbi:MULTISPECIES: xanthine dehydrogenase family protein subunit M [Rhodomicrobium]|uniref:FAD binding domain-containing protein n=1 Tax=Rhodomicrobium TaxID=1068 RepID=UPI000B4A7568|nr:MULTISPECIES: xanthine dehydrogenase family protein subunit M [Rhodomicrobium]